MIELHKLVDEWILIRWEMRYGVARFVPFVARHAPRGVVERSCSDNRQPQRAYQCRVNHADMAVS
jgi:hypothetical protein